MVLPVCFPLHFDSPRPPRQVCFPSHTGRFFPRPHRDAGQNQNLARESQPPAWPRTGAF